MSPTVKNTVHLIFVPDELEYEKLEQRSSRRAELILEMWDEMLLAVPGDHQFPGGFGEVEIEVTEGRLAEPSIEDRVVPLVEKYNTLWKNWQIEYNGADASELGDVQLVSAAAQTGIYYYADLPPGEEVWCRRNLALELKQPSGATEPFRIERAIDPADPSAGTFAADIKVALTHPPIRP